MDNSSNKMDYYCFEDGNRFKIVTSLGIFNNADLSDIKVIESEPGYESLFRQQTIASNLGDIIRLRYTRAPLKAENGYVFSLQIENISDKPFSINSISPLVIDKDEVNLKMTDNWAAFKHGKHMSELTSVYFPGSDKVKKTDFYEEKYETGGYKEQDGKRVFAIHSSGFLEIRDDNDVHMLIGALTMKEQFTNIKLSLKADDESFLATEACCDLDGYTLEPGKCIESEKIILLFYARNLDAINHYNELVGCLNGARKSKALSGWCSWYFYYGRDNEQDIIENIDWLEQHKFPVEVIQIDGGWQKHFGDMDSNDKYSSGMKDIANYIRSRGFIPGIWTAPFHVAADSETARQHPDWLLKKNDGSLVKKCLEGDDCYCLDTSISEVCEHLISFYRTITKEWGYEYLKIDFLMDVCYEENIKYKNNVTRAQALRMGLMAVRDGAGDKTYILACTSMYGPEIGIVDANRTSSDTLSVYGNNDILSYVRAAKLNLNRFFMHNNWWANDPDCLIMRDRKEEFRNIPQTISKLTDDEVKHQVTLYYLCGGMMLASDKLDELSGDRIKLLRSCFPVSPDKGYPVDLYHSAIAEIVSARITAGHAKGGYNVGLFNWGDEPLTKNVRLRDLFYPESQHESFHVYEFYSEKYSGVKNIDDSLSFEIPPHGCVLLALRPYAKNKPCVIGSNLCLGMGAYEIKSFGADDSINIEFTDDADLNGYVLLYLPKSYDPREKELIMIGNGIYRLPVRAVQC